MRFLNKLFAWRAQSAHETQSVTPPKPVASPAAAPLDDRDELALLDALIDRLDEAVVLTAADVAELDGKRREWMATFFDKMLDEGQTFGQASGDLPLYNQSEDQFRAELRRTDNDLKTQIDRFNFHLDRLFEYGDRPPPYWPWRIAIILSKRKELEREKRFLAAYCRHFGRPVNGWVDRVVERAEKKGAFDRFSRGT